MRRRDVLAGLGSLGLIGAGGAIALRGPPSFGEGDDEAEDNDNDEPLELETLESVGSEAGTITVPQEGQVMLVDFFATWCEVCESQMPTLVEARDRLDADVPFLWVTYELPSPSEEDKASVVADWEEKFVHWEEDTEDDWTLALDPDLEFAMRYGAHQGVPTTVAIDGEGEAHWKSTGRKDVEDVVGGVEAALEASR